MNMYLTVSMGGVTSVIEVHGHWVDIPWTPVLLILLSLPKKMGVNTS